MIQRAISAPYAWLISIAFIQAPAQLMPNGVEEILAFQLDQAQLKRSTREFNRSATWNHKGATVHGKQALCIATFRTKIDLIAIADHKRTHIQVVRGNGS